VTFEFFALIVCFGLAIWWCVEHEDHAHWAFLGVVTGVFASAVYEMGRWLLSLF
jgi:hypothetical protein